MAYNGQVAPGTLKKYGLSLGQWHELLVAFPHCPGCEKVWKNRTRVPCVDHDHHSGLVRGLLCSPCNEAIGQRHDNAAWFHNVAWYLNRPPAVRVIGEVYVPGSPGAEGEL